MLSNSNILRTPILLFSLAIIFSCWSCTDTPRCNDGVQNGTEVAIDCGGSCDPCFSCEDGILNQGEQAIDCGGPCAPCTGVASWELFALPTTEDNSQLDYHFFDQANGLLLSEFEGLWLTNDRGDSWTQLTPPANAYRFAWMKPINEFLVYVMTEENTSNGARHRLYKVTNLLNTWTPVAANRPSDLTEGRTVFAMHFISEDHYLLAHEFSFGRNYLSETTDGGNTWTTLFDSFDFFGFNQDYLLGLHYFANGTIYLFDVNNQLVSNDNGASWTAFPLDNVISIEANTNQLASSTATLTFIDSERGWYRRNGSTTLRTTEDGGRTWSPYFDGQTSVFFDGSVTTIANFTDPQPIIFSYHGCVPESPGYCGIAWQEQSLGQWTRIGLTPVLGDPEFEALYPVKPYFFDEVAYALDGNTWAPKRWLLRLVSG